jgi:hypothetical protein
MLVTFAGYDIMKGRSLLKQTDADNFAHLILACLFHDIGYVRGILEGDGSDGYLIDTKGGKTSLPRGSSDAALTPYHVDRSKLFVMDRIGASKLVDASRIARAIEFTRFPSAPEPQDAENEEGLLVRAADFIGQLGDPHYLRKANALYYEFEEAGMNRQLDYTSPPTSQTDIRSSTGTTFRRISRLPSDTLMSRRVGSSGSPAFTATSFVRSADSIYPGQSVRGGPAQEMPTLV